jgi:hypothetical protein
MLPKIFEGSHVNRFKNVTVYYQCRYEYRGIGIVYDASGGFGGPRAHFVHGVVPWTLRCILSPRALIEQMVHDDIDMLDLKKLRALLVET